MKLSWKRWLVLLAPLAVISLGPACSGPKPVATPAPSVGAVGNATAQTPLYSIELLVGPVQSIMMGLEMSMTDQGQPVNRHLEIHIYQRASRTAVKGASPTVRVKNLGTGTVREFSSVRECSPPNDHGAGPHYGDNLYLPEGKYTITVAVRNESASFDVSV